MTLMGWLGHKTSIQSKTQIEKSAIQELILLKIRRNSTQEIMKIHKSF